MFYIFRLDLEEPEPVNRPPNRMPNPLPDCRPNCPPILPKPAPSTYVPPAVSAAPVLLVVPAQPCGPYMTFQSSSLSQSFIAASPPLAPTTRPVMPNKSLRPCGACGVPQCGGQRKRYTPSREKTAGSTQKIFTYCPATRKSTTAGFEGVVYTSFEDFKCV